MNTDFILLSSFKDPRFRSAFQNYFAELDIPVSDWDGLFQEMDQEGCNLAFLLPSEDGGAAGFLQFQLTSFSHWFLEEKFGFIREFWVDPAFRSKGLGTMLLETVEQYCMEHGAYRVLLTADDAVDFYLARGYRKALGAQAKNRLAVLTKNLMNGCV